MNAVIMTKLKINSLDITKINYKTWAVGGKMHLRKKWALRNHRLVENYIRWEKEKPFYLHQFNDCLEDEVYHKKDLEDLWWLNPWKKGSELM